MLTDRDKTYEATLLLGMETDTQDTTGTVLSETDASGLTEEAVREAVLCFVGDYDQIPPMYSALKVNGRKLCRSGPPGRGGGAEAQTGEDLRHHHPFHPAARRWS